MNVERFWTWLLPPAGYFSLSSVARSCRFVGSVTEATGLDCDDPSRHDVVTRGLFSLEGSRASFSRAAWPCSNAVRFEFTCTAEFGMPGFGNLAARWWMPVLFIIVAGHITNVCVTLFLHRAQTHRGVRLHYLAALPMRLWLWLTTAIVTKEWVACHRKHHAFADREGDPHSPLLEGLRNILLKGAFYYRKAVRQPGMLEKYGKGTPNDWLERHLLSRLNWLGIVVMLVIDIYLFGFFVGPLVWGIQMLWIPFWAAGVVNGIGHALGYRNFQVKDESRNITPIAIWLGGEELHNNHHADPKSARFAAKWFEFDIGWIYIRMLQFLRLAKVEYARGDARRGAEVETQLGTVS
jgi:stearoyl-CoA desaturase (Delta-9 desaturase)